MAVTVNGVALAEEKIQAELTRHQDTSDPMRAAIQELILRELIRQKGAALGLTTATADEMIGAVWQSQVKMPTVDEAACKQFFADHPDYFIRAEAVDASHILFVPTKTMPWVRLRARAKKVLNKIIARPQDFAALAKQHSHCPSRDTGGKLGPVNQGMLVPELEKALFALPEHAICPRVIETRFGLHILRVEKKFAQSCPTFTEAQQRITDYLTAITQQQTLSQYLHTLVEEADIQGFDMR